MKKKVVAPKLPKSPVMSRSAVALRIRSINAAHVQRHKAHNGRLNLAKSVAEKTARTNHEIEYNQLWGHSLHGRLGGHDADKLAALKSYLGR